MVQMHPRALEPFPRGLHHTEEPLLTAMLMAIACDVLQILAVCQNTACGKPVVALCIQDLKRANGLKILCRNILALASAIVPKALQDGFRFQHTVDPSLLTSLFFCAIMKAESEVRP